MKKATPYPMMGPDKDYQAEDDHRTLTRAQEIGEDRGRMRNVSRHHTKLTRSLAKTRGFLQGKR